MSDLTKDEYNTARVLLADLGSAAPDAEQPLARGPVAPGIAPFAVPDEGTVPAGYTVRWTQRSNADGSTELIRDVVPLEAAAPGPAAPRRTAPAPPAPIPSAITERRTLPQWLGDNRRHLRGATYAAGAVAVTTAGAVYGNDIAAGVSAGATALWGATLTVLKFTGIAVGLVIGVGLFCRIAFGGRRRRGGTFEGTFEGSMRGEWH